jgi:hypothetical protein
MLHESFARNAVGFARGNAMIPGDQAHQYSSSLDTVSELEGFFEGFRHTQMSPGQKIAHITMSRGLSSRGSGAVKVIPSLGGAGLPVYFLPWDPRGAAVEITIPSRNPNLPERTHPRFFFTAVLSGCSVFIKGDPQFPTVYHCGTAGGNVGTSTQGNSNDFFERLVRTSKFRGIGARPTGQLHKVKSSDYMRAKSGANPALEALTDEVMDNLKRHYAGRVMITDVTPWGCVFGVRDERNWAFYLQQNCTVIYKRWEDVEREIVRKKKVLGIFTKNVTKSYITRGLSGEVAVARNMGVTQLFPGRRQTTPMYPAHAWAL